MGMTLEEAYARVGAERQENPFFKPAKQQSFVPIAIVPPRPKWQEKAASFVNWANSQLLKQPEVLSALEKRGLSLEAVEKYKLGWCSKSFRCERSDWGLPDETDDTGELKSLYLPKGIVVPTIEKDDSVVRIKIRCSGWKPESNFPKYKAIQGSMNGLNIIGNTNNPLMVVVESELDAYAIDFACSDFAFVVAVGSNTKNPDNVTDYLAKKKHLLICRDNDNAGKTMLFKWRKLYLHASDYPTRKGKDIGEAIQQGEDIRKWLMQALTGSNLEKGE
jgi:hypothetical protein